MPNELDEGAAALIEHLATCLAAATPQAAAIVPRPAGPAVSPSPRGLPVLRWLAVLAAQAPTVAQPLVLSLSDLSPRLSWRQTYRPDETAPEFRENYGWTELVGSNGLFHDPAVSAGFLVLGPNTRYPPHHHPALEYYVPLSGAADWYDADRGWRREPPLALIAHPPHVQHAMTTGEAPLLAYFHWSGKGVGESARLV